MAWLDRRRSDVDAERVLSALASRQDGVVSRRQLLAARIDGKWIDRRIKAGRLLAIHRGVYAVGHAAVTDRGRIRAALLAAGPTAAASHGTAARLWELTPSMPEVLEVTVTTRARRSRAGLVIHETRIAPDVRTRHGIPLTAPLRTLADLAATRPRHEIERAAIEALVKRLVTPAQLEAAGHRVLRFTHRRLAEEPLLVAARLAQVLGPGSVAA